MKLRLACADFAFPLLPLQSAFKLIGMLGFEGVDVGVFEGRSQLQPSQVMADMPAAAAKLAAEVEDAGLKFADIFYQATSFDSVAANHPDPAERQKGRELFLRMLEFTLRCNAPHMTALPGVEWPDVPHADSVKRSAEELVWRAAQAKSVGVVFSVECHLGSFAPTPATALELAEAAPGLTLTLDYTHFTSQGFSDDECEKLVPYASHFHARGSRPGRLQASAKENIIDYPRVLRAMAAANYPGYVGVEFVWQDWEHCNEVDNLSETIMLRDLLRASANGGKA